MTRLDVLGLLALEQWRLEGNLMEVYKIEKVAGRSQKRVHVPIINVHRYKVNDKRGSGDLFF